MCAYLICMSRARRNKRSVHTSQAVAVVTVEKQKKTWNNNNHMHLKYYFLVAYTHVHDLTHTQKIFYLIFVIFKNL
jgi:hypothetical protein